MAMIALNKSSGRWVKDLGRPHGEVAKCCLVAIVFVGGVAGLTSCEIRSSTQGPGEVREVEFELVGQILPDAVGPSFGTNVTVQTRVSDLNDQRLIVGCGDGGAGLVSAYEIPSLQPIYSLALKAPDGLGACPGDIAQLPDMDGDGWPELALGCSSIDYLNGLPPCRVLIVDGADAEPELELQASEVNDGFGYRLASIGDIDHDGRNDLAVLTAWGDSANGARARVSLYSTANWQSLGNIASGDQAGYLLGPLASVDPNAGSDGLRLLVSDRQADAAKSAVCLFAIPEGTELLRLRPSELDVACFGWCVAALPASPTGLTAFAVITAPNRYSSTLRSGAVYCYSILDGGLVWTSQPTSPNPGFGSSLAVCGDVDGGGRSDVVVGAPGFLADQRGRIFLISGESGRIIVEFSPKDVSMSFGSSVCTWMPGVVVDSSYLGSLAIGDPSYVCTGRSGAGKPALGAVFVLNLRLTK